MTGRAAPASGAGRAAGATTGPREVVILAIALQPLIWAGPGRRFPWALVGLEAAGAWFWAAAAATLLLLGPPLARRLDRVRGPDGQAPVDRWATGLVLVCFPLAAAYDLLAARHFASFGYGSPLPLLVIAGAGTLALVAWVRAGRPLRWGAAVAVTAGVAHRLASIAVFPADERRSDMLFMIAGALDLWRAGHSAYAPVRAAMYGDAGLAMPYLPGTWLAHVPAHALGVDLRLGGAVVTLTLGIAVVASLRSTRTELLAILLFASPYHLFRHDLYFDHFLALTAAVFAWTASAGARAWPWIGALVGVAAATRQWAWVYGPFVLLAASAAGAGGERRDVAVGRRSGHRGVLVRLAASGAIAAAVGAIVCLPGIVPDPARFRAVQRLMVAAHAELCLGFAPAALAAGFIAWLRPAQIAVAVACYVRALAAAMWEWTTSPAILATGWITLVAVIALSPFLENYFWLTPGFAALGLALGADRAAVWGERPGTAPLAERGA